MIIADRLKMAVGSILIPGKHKHARLMNVSSESENVHGAAAFKGKDSVDTCTCSNLAEDFSIMKQSKSDLRSQMTGQNLAAVLRIATSIMQPDFDRLVSDFKQLHVSH